ncbi:phosphate regulon sensor histidine kinase PhoR [Limnohabitans sp. MMS-10A-160]|uniref:phosphate regulon sensor histidine kinase PhoR n=1 Tax=unclassified Limnohabitans TaxID=2626134 RepID=UPI000D3C3D57|nr:MULTISPECIES: phosphate regulon sensor histidine kinase PhoR [unclassified Limnohabitans]PUE17998.1 phosphate regulon sensor histidine kinase PhoR [Limnohabitans sp. MMS-10A-192]PUE27227.1 phosphate regulon sensor histidine kinase PhoR [Limnohabitans sp. MMS-10A-160]
MLVIVFEFFSWAVVAAILGGWLAGLVGALVFAFGAATAHICLLAWRSNRLLNWLCRTGLNNPLKWSGVWLEIGQRIQRLLLQREKATEDLEQRLKDFLQAIQASPNGVILLDSEARIEWCNDTGAVHLGLDIQRDYLQHIVHLVRDPVFSKYYAQDTHTAEAVIDGRAATLSKNIKLSVQLHAYGEGRQLLLTRDITTMAQADAMRRDFVANVSHEIRTPLTVMSGFVETMQAIPLEEDERQRYLQMMAVQAERMQSLVADLLTLSQLEGGMPPRVQDKISLPELMGQVQSDAMALSAVLSGQDSEQLSPVHVFKFDPIENWSMMGARSEILSAVSNLVSNAVRYTPAGGRICARWYCEADDLCFSVSDSGPGIAAEHLPRLSERFYRVDRSRSRETGGTGLGLAITKHVAQRHGGELRIESQVGNGSTFSLVFPISRLLLTQ